MRFGMVVNLVFYLVVLKEGEYSFSPCFTFVD